MAQFYSAVDMHDPDAHRTIVAGQLDLMVAFERRDALEAADRIQRFVIEAEASYINLLEKISYGTSSSRRNTS